jgi:hypothetical protein
MMNETEFRVLDVLSRSMGNPVSISGLTKEIRLLYRSAYYSNIYRALMSLSKDSTIRIEKHGRSSILSLNFDNYLLPDLLAQVELEKKRNFLEVWPEAQSLFASLDALGRLTFVESVALIDPQHNMKLNRAELLTVIDERTGDRLDRMRDLIRGTWRRFIRTTHLIITEEELIDSLKSQEKNPVREMLSNRVILYSPCRFWALIRNAYTNGMRIRFETKQTNPLEISESDLTYNMSRFGYIELGPEVKRGTEISIEYAVASIFLGEDERRIVAVPVLLAKTKPNYRLLAFLAQKYGFADKLLGVLVLLRKTTSSEELESTITDLEETGIRPARLDENHIRNTMLLYGVGAGQS